jgi:hypothetical protein
MLRTNSFSFAPMDFSVSACNPCDSAATAEPASANSIAPLGHASESTPMLLIPRG